MTILSMQRRLRGLVVFLSFVCCVQAVSGACHAFCCLAFALCRGRPLTRHRQHFGGTHRWLAKQETQSADLGRVRIEQVTTSERSLDVLVFRNISESPEEVIAGQQHGQLTAAEAVSVLLAKRAKPMERAGLEGVVQFVALSDEAEFSRARGVVGAVDVKFVEAARALTFQLPARVHVENLRVHENARRRGIGTALLHATIQYASEDTAADAVTLKVEKTNSAAAELYEQEGFAFSEDVYAGFMVKYLVR